MYKVLVKGKLDNFETGKTEPVYAHVTWNKKEPIPKEILRDYIRQYNYLVKTKIDPKLNSMNQEWYKKYGQGPIEPGTDRWIQYGKFMARKWNHICLGIIWTLRNRKAPVQVGCISIDGNPEIIGIVKGTNDVLWFDWNIYYDMPNLDQFTNLVNGE